MRSVLPAALVLSALSCGVALALLGPAGPTAEVSGGLLRGKIVLTRAGRRARAFLGIPYAQPPVGPLRFQPPSAPDGGWEGERRCVDHPPACVQPDGRHGLPVGDEDCLYLSLYVLDNYNKALELNGCHLDNEGAGTNLTATDVGENEDAKNKDDVLGGVNNSSNFAEQKNNIKAECSGGLPVIVYFHGGTFERGSSDLFTHEYLLDSGIVLVTVQYRLGLLGFLSTGDGTVAGNMGLKDQRLALRWVADNIAAFGGNADKITIVGDGVGAAAVHYHMLFTDAKQAPFRAGISMSGTATAPWAFRPPAEVARMADRIATISGCPKPYQELVDCLREKRAGEFVSMLQIYKNETLGGCGDWAMAVPTLGAVLEPVGAEGAFVTANPWERRLSQPWLVGVTSKEMLYEFTPYQADRRDRLFKELDKCFNSVLPTALGFRYSIAGSEDLADKVRSFYFQNKPISRELFSQVVDATSDGLVVYPAFEAVRRSGRRSTWLYHFDFIGANTYGPSTLDSRIGAGRGDDLFCLFPRPLGKNVHRKNKDPDTAMSQKLIKLWTNFARHMDPTPEEEFGVRWLPVAPSTTFLNFAQETLTVERPFLANRMNFWAMEPFPHRDDYYDLSNSVEDDKPTVYET